MSKATMIDEQNLRELAEHANLSIQQRADMNAAEFEAAEANRFDFRHAAPTAILALLDELQSLRSERTAWRVTEENAESAIKQARDDALEEAAAICKAKAVHMEREAQAALADGEEEEDVTSLRSSAWLLSVCASAIETLKGKP